MTNPLKLWSARACPFAHRTRLVLAEKRTRFELIEIDLQNKPPWFSEVSVYGKVPALEHDGRRFVESAVINEYLDEVFADPRLLPETSAARAHARFWIDWANTRFVPAWGKLLRAADPRVANEATHELLASLETIERAFSERSVDGPYWFGDRVSLVDLTLYPWFERWSALEHYRGVSLPESATQLSRWRAAVASRDSVVAHENTTAYYVERLARYATSGEARRPSALPLPT